MGGAQRLFFALWPDEAVARSLHDQSTRCLAECGGRAMRSETLHMTLAFLGQIGAEQLEALNALAAEISLPAFDVRLDVLGYWRRNRILWAGCREVPESLRVLAADLRRQLDAAGIAYAPGDFVPHVTLLRDARCMETPTLAQPIAWPVREFRLVCSEPGAQYRPLARWAFR